MNVNVLANKNTSWTNPVAKITSGVSYALHVSFLQHIKNILSIRLFCLWSIWDHFSWLKLRQCLFAYYSLTQTSGHFGFRKFSFMFRGYLIIDIHTHVHSLSWDVEEQLDFFSLKEALAGGNRDSGLCPYQGPLWAQCMLLFSKQWRCFGCNDPDRSFVKAYGH